MKKRGLILLLITLILITPLVFSAELTDEEKIDQAYECLEDKVDGICDTLTTEEKAFTLLAIDECQAELVEDSLNESECWPSPHCNLRTTAQAVLALDNTGVNTEKAQSWLLSQNSTPADMIWYLEIDSSEPTSCTITYSDLVYDVDILENKKLSNNAGVCLDLAQNDYWLEIDPNCYDREFEISCDETFLTTLLFRKAGSETVHVLDKTSSASPGGTTFEKVNSFCFGIGNCDYEGTLWAAMVLDSLGEEISPYLPYLIVMAEDNERLIPDTFLYFLTGKIDYRSSVLLMQKGNKYWLESGDRYYDTAMAMYPFQQESPAEKENAKTWLLSIQDSKGCWENNIRNTAFILASLFPRNYIVGGGSGTGDGLDCEASGYYCMSGASCEGQIFDDYNCPSLFRCCSVSQQIQTCSELGGDICGSGQVCRQGTIISTGDLDYGEECCIEGYCETVSSSLSECESNGGICKFTCSSSEEESYYACENSEVCCIYSSSSSSGKSYWWIWVLLILIILLVIGIIFRDKLRMFWFRIKPKKSKPSKPSSSPRQIPKVPERRILLPAETSKPKIAPKRRIMGKSKSQKELDDVLKRLKDMGK